MPETIKNKMPLRVGMPIRITSHPLSTWIKRSGNRVHIAFESVTDATVYSEGFPDGVNLSEIIDKARAWDELLSSPSLDGVAASHFRALQKEDL